MTGAENGDGLAGIALAVATKHIRHARRRCALTCSLSPIAVRPLLPAGLGCVPCARGIDHRIGAQRFGTLAVAIADLKRRQFTPLRLDLVEADATDRGHLRFGLDVLLQEPCASPAARCSWRQDRRRSDRRPGRASSSLSPPAAAPTPCRCCIPRARTCARAPIGARHARPRARLQNDWAQVPLKRVGRSSEADGAGSDDGDSFWCRRGH